MVSERRPRKVLIVDDEPLVRQTLAYVLQDEYEVVTVASGEEAIEASEREAFPVVILDLCMEGLSGIETLRRLKKVREDQNVIILTAYESVDTAISALNLGAFNYLTKPFERAHLKQIISRGFDLYEAHSARTQDMQQRLMGVHDSFFSLLCHEFNTPLNVILGFAELLQGSGRDDPEFPTWVQHIRDSGNHLHDILMEIVDYTAASHLAEAGVEKFFVPGELLTPVFKAAHLKGVTLDFKAEGEAGGRLLGPSDAILMIVKKLARMASHRSKRVRVSASIVSHDGPNLKVVVSGTGIVRDGIESNEIEKLFEPYQYTPTSESSCAVSLGLELATCRKIAEYAHATVEGAFDATGELELIAQVPVGVAR